MTDVDSGVDQPPPPPSLAKPSHVPLPPYWKKAKDKEGEVYYYNSVTKETCWYHPSLEGTPSLSVNSPPEETKGVLINQELSSHDAMNPGSTTSTKTPTNTKNGVPPTSDEHPCSETLSTDDPVAASIQTLKTPKVEYYEEEFSNEPSISQSVSGQDNLLCVKMEENNAEFRSNDGSTGVDDESLTDGQSTVVFSSKKHKQATQSINKYSCSVCRRPFKTRKNYVIHQNKCSLADVNSKIKKLQEEHASIAKGNHDRCKSTCGETSDDTQCSPQTIYIAKESDEIMVSSDEPPSVGQEICVETENISECVTGECSLVMECQSEIGDSSLPAPSTKKGKTKKDSNCFLCSLCNQTFKGKTTFRAHQIKCSLFEHKTGIEQPDKITPMRQTDERSSSQDDSNKEKQSVTKNAKIRKEKSVSQGGFRRYYNLRREHLNTSTRCRIPLCKLCGRTFTSYVGLRAHHKGQHASQHAYRCPCCQVGFKDESRLKRHIPICGVFNPVSVRSPSEKTGLYQCPICKKEYRSTYSLSRHHVMIHSKFEPFKCDVCGKRFKHSESLTRHSWVHSDEEPFFCDKCGKTLKTKSGLAKHKKNQTCQNVDYLCDICGKSLKGKQALRQHRQWHSKGNFQKCPDCGKEFMAKLAFEKHYRTHTGEKPAPIKCDLCDKFLATKQSLRMHIRVHTGDLPYKCTAEGCGKAYCDKTALRRHSFTHTGERPYKCEQCGKTLRTLTGFKVHKIAHTGIKPYPCDKCGKAFAMKYTLKHHRCSNSTAKSSGAVSDSSDSETCSTVSEQSSYDSPYEESEVLEAELCVSNTSGQDPGDQALGTDDVQYECATCRQVFYRLVDWDHHECVELQ